MSISVNPAHCYCKKADRYVSLEQTEGECRDANKCEDNAPCPLEGEFGQDRFRRALETLGVMIGQGWAKSLGHKDDL
jgi:hypothetical protein